MAATPEAKVKAEIKKILDKHNVLYSMPIGSPYGASNMCDFICCIPTVFGTGQYMEVEAKATARSKVSVRQQDKLELVRKANGIAVVVHVGSLKEFDSLVENAVGGDNTVSFYRDSRKAKMELQYACLPGSIHVEIDPTKSTSRGGVRYGKFWMRIGSGATVGIIAHEAMHVAERMLPDEDIESITFEKYGEFVRYTPSYKNLPPMRFLEEVRCSLVQRITDDVAKVFLAMNKPLV